MIRQRMLRILYVIPLVAMASIAMAAPSQSPQGDHVYAHVTLATGAELVVSGGSTVDGKVLAAVWPAGHVPKIVETVRVELCGKDEPPLLITTHLHIISEAADQGFEVLDSLVLNPREVLLAVIDGHVLAIWRIHIGNIQSPWTVLPAKSWAALAKWASLASTGVTAKFSINESGTPCVEIVQVGVHTLLVQQSDGEFTPVRHWPEDEAKAIWPHGKNQ